jgi:hypothetical protein
MVRSIEPDRILIMHTTGTRPRNPLIARQLRSQLVCHGLVGLAGAQLLVMAAVADMGKTGLAIMNCTDYCTDQHGKWAPVLMAGQPVR